MITLLMNRLPKSPEPPSTPSFYPLLNPHYPLLAIIYPYLRLQGRSWYPTTPWQAASASRDMPWRSPRKRKARCHCPARAQALTALFQTTMLGNILGFRKYRRAYLHTSMFRSSCFVNCICPTDYYLTWDQNTSFRHIQRNTTASISAICISPSVESASRHIDPVEQAETTLPKV